MRMTIDRSRPIHIKREWPGALVVLPAHPRIRRDEIWQAGKRLVRRVRG